MQMDAALVLRHSLLSPLCTWPVSIVHTSMGAIAADARMGVAVGAMTGAVIDLLNR